MLIVIQGAPGGDLVGVGPPADRGEGIRDGAAKRRDAATALRVVSSGEPVVGCRAAGSSSRAGVDARFAERERGVRDIHFRPAMVRGS